MQKCGLIQKELLSCPFSVANNTGYGDNQRTHYFDCAIFGKRAESRLKEYMLKGQQVVVEGEVSLNQYEKKKMEQAAQA